MSELKCVSCGFWVDNTAEKCSYCGVKEMQMPVTSTNAITKDGTESLRKYWYKKIKKKIFQRS